MFGCYAIVESAVQEIFIDLLVCSKCSKYLENDINDKCMLKQSTASKSCSDWLLNLRISFIIYLPATRAKFASEKIVIVAGINELKSYVYVLLSHCFSLY